MIHDTTPRLERPLYFGTLILKACRQLREYHRISRQRRELLALSDGMLKDIGLSRADAIREGEKPFWCE